LNKIQKAIIIGHDAPKSKQLVKTCIDSCDKHGLPYEVLKHNINGMGSVQAYKSVGCPSGIKILPRWAMAHACHILAWKRIIELNHACVILEHDAIVLSNSVYNLEVPDMAIAHLGGAAKYRPDFLGVHPESRSHPAPKITQ
jgi:hypothetical protein